MAPEPKQEITLVYAKADGNNSDVVSTNAVLLLIASGVISGGTSVWSAGMEA